MKRLYVDMDGTLCRFHDEARYLERMYEKGFFLSLRPFHSVVDAVRYLASSKGVEVFILSSCVTDHCIEEKKNWLKVFLPEIPESNYIFTAVGENKALRVGHTLSRNDVLIDDYNVNLEEWQNAGGLSIKLVNNINDKGLFGPRWVGPRVREEDPARIIANGIKTIVNNPT